LFFLNVFMCMSYTCVNAVAKILYLRHDFYTIIFKIKHKSYIASGSVHPPSPPPFPMKSSGCPPGKHAWSIQGRHSSGRIGGYHVNPVRVNGELAEIGAWQFFMTCHLTLKMLALATPKVL